MRPISKDWSSHFKEVLRSLSEGLLLTFLLALILRTFVLEASIMTATSMSPLLLPGEVIWLWKLPFKVGSPPQLKLNELVVFQYSEGEVSDMGRIQGLPGDRIALKKGHLFRNGKKLENQTWKDIEIGPLVVPPQHVWILPDNPEKRYISKEDNLFVPLDKIVGLVVAHGPRLIWEDQAWLPSISFEMNWVHPL